MKNLKNFAFGLLVAVLALGFSAFTSKSTKIVGQLKKGAITADYLVQPLEDQFEQHPGIPNSDNCEDVVTYDCIYDVTPTGKLMIPDKPSYTTAEIDEFLLEGWLLPNEDSRPALYVEP